MTRTLVTPRGGAQLPSPPAPAGVETGSGGASAPARGWRLLEAGAVLAACLLPLWLGRQPAAADPRALGSPALWALATAACVWVAPGFALWRLAGESRRWPAIAAFPFSVAFGLAWLMLPGAAVLLLGADISTMSLLVTVLNGALGVGYLAYVLAARPAAHVRDEPAPGLPSIWLLTGALLAAARLLVVASRSTRLTFGGDEWVAMGTVRYFLEARTIASTHYFDLWSLAIALLVRLAGLDLLDAYRLYLTPFLVPAAALAFLVLARTLLRDWNLACFAFVLQAIYCLSDMHTRGSGAGMGLLQRIPEDKYMSSLLVLPLAQAVFLAWLRSPRKALVAVFGALTVLAVALNPLAIVWLAVSCGLTFLAAWGTGHIKPPRSALAGLAAALCAATLVAGVLRSMRPGSYFLLHDPGWSFNAALLSLSRNQLIILSLEKGWFMAHPWLLRHPFLVAALLCAVLLLPGFRRSIAVQFVTLGVLVPLALVYNPLTATFLGGWITPWMIDRVLWVVPVSLALALGFARLLESLERARGRWPGLRHGGRLLGPVAAMVLALAALLMAGRMQESWRALRARNHVRVAAAEQEILRAVAREPRLSGNVLAPVALSIWLPAWTSRATPHPGLGALRDRDQALLKGRDEFLASPVIGSEQVGFLRSTGTRYIILENTSPLAPALGRSPAAFPMLYRGVRYSLHAWRPERWAGSAAP